MILGPVMLALEIDPLVSTAVSGFTVLFTSSSTTSQFTIAGAIHFMHAWLFMLLSLFGSLLGTFVLRKIIKKYNKPSIIVWIIFGVLCLAGLVLPYNMISNILSAKRKVMEFGKFC